MWRVLKAFAWLRWRMLLNAIEGRPGRDVVERFAGAFGELVPIVAAVVMIPSALGLAGVAGYSGFRLAQGDPPPRAFESVRYTLLAISALAAAGPLVFPTAGRTNAVRLLLLPIERRVLYLTQALSALVEPWMLLAMASVLAVPVGLLAGGAFVDAARALAGGVFLLGTFTGMTAVVTSALDLLARNRRRGELAALVFVLFVPLLAFVPGPLAETSSIPAAHREGDGRAADRSRPSDAGAHRAVAVLPSELYVRSALGGAEQGKEVTVALLALASAALALHGLAFWGFVRVLASPGVSGARRVRGRRARVWRIPGLSRGASAVAANQLRLAFRTPRGRSCLISPPLVFAILYVLLRRSPDGLAFGPIHLNSGAALAALASFVAMMATLPLAMNQFAIDRGGLTLAALAPLRTAELLRGKAVGNALAAAVPMGLCVGTSAILLPSGSPASWLSLPPAFVSIHLLVSPAAAILSAVFPRAVDLNSIGSGSNAHGAAGALGTLSFVAAGVPCAALAVLPAAVFARPALGPVVLTLWAAACAGAGAALFRLAENLFERRRENLLMIR